MRNLLPKALNADMLAIISTNPSPESIQTCLQVLPRSTIAIPRYNQLAPSCRHVVGIVDRSADIASAAKHLVAARFTFNGTSPYAPDIVFVNEFVIKEFTESVLQQSIPFLAASPTSQKDEKNNGKKQDFGAEYEKEDWRVSIVTQGAAGSIVRLENSSSNGNVALPAKKSTPVFAITAITSPDHAIDLVASTPLLAAYHFGEPAHANYLTKFVSAEATFVNHIPTQLLLGPPASSFQPFNLESRYTVEHFSKLSPAFTSSYVKRQNTSTTAAISSEKDAGKLLRDATEPVKEEKRKESLSVGFFEQGIMIGAGVYGLPLLACISVGLYYSVRAGMQAVSLLR
jgi:aldehyde dehydrogenase (NAD+)